MGRDSAILPVVEVLTKSGPAQLLSLLATANLR